MISLRQRAALIVCAAAALGFTGSAVAQPAHNAHAPIASSPYDPRSPDAQPYPMAGSQAAVAASSSSARAQAPARANGRRGHTGDAFGGYTSNPIVAEARKYLGTNPTGRSRLWCGAFMDLVLKRTGHQGGGNLARAYTKIGKRISTPQVGAIAVLTRGKNGGHVGVVSGIDPNGNPIIVSGNHNRTVAEAVYPASRVTAYVLPES